jgi:hypothetical protein
VSQSSFIAAVLLAGLVLFIAARGRLGAYTAVLFGKAPGLPPFLGIPLINPPAAGAPAGGGGKPAGPAGDPAKPATDPATGDVLTTVEDVMTSALSDAAIAAIGF